MKRLFWIVLSAMLLIACVVSASGEASVLPEEATFERVNLHQGYPSDAEKSSENRGDVWYLSAELEAENVWYYKSSNPTDNIMYAPVYILFADVTADEDALAALDNAGLLQLAEENGGHAFVIGKNNGETWNEADVEVFRSVEVYILGEGVPLAWGGGYIPWGMSFGQRTFLFAEGEAADYVTEYLSRNAQRIAGVCLVNATAVPAEAGTLPIPAYLVNADEAVIDYYKALNGTDTEEAAANGVRYVNGAETIMQMIVANEGQLNAALTADFWSEIGQNTARMCLGISIYYPSENFRTSQEFILTRLPNLEMLDMTEIRHTEGVLEGAAEISEWYIYIPNSILNDESGATYPLFVVAHGSGDHPEFEAESQGYVELAGYEKCIVLSFRHQNLSGETVVSDVNKLIDAVIAEYPVDVSRIYMGGFSMGGMRTGAVMFADPTRFAGVVVLHSANTGFVDADENGLCDNWEELAASFDIPLYYQLGERDSLFDGDSQRTTITQYALLDEVNVSFTDLSEDNPFGVVVEGQELVSWNDSYSGMTYTKTLLPNADGIPMIELSFLREAAHVHFCGNMFQAWDFLSQFSRAEDGSLIYTPAAE